MKTIFGEVFTKISNGILIGCLGAILICWGLYETSEIMMLIGMFILVIGFVLAIINENRTIKDKKKSDERIEKLENKVEFYKQSSQKNEDDLAFLKQDMDIIKKELEEKNIIIERHRKIRLSAIKNSEVWEDCEGLE